MPLLTPGLRHPALWREGTERKRVKQSSAHLADARFSLHPTPRYISTCLLLSKEDTHTFPLRIVVRLLSRWNLPEKEAIGCTLRFLILRNIDKTRLRQLDHIFLSGCAFLHQVASLLYLLKTLANHMSIRLAFQCPTIKRR